MSRRGRQRYASDAGVRTAIVNGRFAEGAIQAAFTQLKQSFMVGSL